MNVHSLTLKNFRNYNSEHIEFSPYTNIIYGNNAQGKTNLLEAVSLFSLGRSYRSKKDSQLVGFDKKFAGLETEFESAGRTHSAGMRIMPSGKKKILVNDVPVTKLSMLMQYLNTVVFSPEDLDLVKGSPAVRRKFLDFAISQLYPLYLNALMGYNKNLVQKNSLLKLLRAEGKTSDSMLSVWNSQLCGFGVKVMSYRKKFIGDINLFAGELHSKISGEKLDIIYRPSMDFTDADEDTAEKLMLGKLEENQKHEIERGSSLYGIHRDDMRIIINGSDAGSFASQGQQRTAVLSVVMAQTEYINSVKGEYPVLLLDDIMSELDKSRRSFLSRKIRDKQVLITCTDADLVSVPDNVKLFEINGGSIKTRE